MPFLSKIFKCAALLAIPTLIWSCSQAEQNRIPYAPVRIVFTTESQWQLYGTPSASDVAKFIKAESIPTGFPYTAMTETGFGGVLLVCDVMGDYKAFDIACPVEAKRNVRIQFEDSDINPRCPVCGSSFDVLSGIGIPLSGPAKDLAYPLQRYRVVLTNRPLEFATVTR